MHPILENSKHITPEQKSSIHSIEMECGEFKDIEDIKIIAAVAEGKMSGRRAREIFIKKNNLEIQR